MRNGPQLPIKNWELARLLRGDMAEQKNHLDKLAKCFPPFLLNLESTCDSFFYSLIYTVFNDIFPDNYICTFPYLQS